MKKEHKELLLKDLCARLPYGVKVKHEAQDFSSTLLWVDAERLSAGRKADKKGVGSDWGSIEFIKPYLRPMSSMTEKEFVYFMGLRGRMLKSHEIQSIMKESFNMPLSIGIGTTLGSYSNKIDWLIKNHFDYRGLIPKSLAIEVTEKNNPYKD